MNGGLTTWCQDFHLQSLGCPSTSSPGRKEHLCLPESTWCPSQMFIRMFLKLSTTQFLVTSFILDLIRYWVVLHFALSGRKVLCLNKQKSKPFMNFIHNCIIDSSPGGLEDVYSFVVVSCLYYTYPHSLPVSEILSFPPPSLHRLCALTAGKIPVKYTSCNLPPLEAALPIFLQHFLYQH